MNEGQICSGQGECNCHKSGKQIIRKCHCKDNYYGKTCENSAAVRLDASFRVRSSIRPSISPSLPPCQDDSHACRSLFHRYSLVLKLRIAFIQTSYIIFLCSCFPPAARLWSIQIVRVMQSPLRPQYDVQRMCSHVYQWDQRNQPRKMPQRRHQTSREITRWNKNNNNNKKNNNNKSNNKSNAKINRATAREELTISY